MGIITVRTFAKRLFPILQADVPLTARINCYSGMAMADLQPEDLRAQFHMGADMLSSMTIEIDYGWNLRAHLDISIQRTDEGETTHDSEGRTCTKGVVVCSINAPALNAPMSIANGRLILLQRLTALGTLIEAAFAGDVVISSAEDDRKADLQDHEDHEEHTVRVEDLMALPRSATIISTAGQRYIKKDKPKGAFVKLRSSGTTFTPGEIIAAEGPLLRVIKKAS